MRCGVIFTKSLYGGSFKIFTLVLVLISASYSVSWGREFLKVPGTSIILKLVGASDNIYATTRKGNDKTKSFNLETLRPYFVIEKDGNYFKISDQQMEGGRVGYVREEHVIPWSTREGLHFRPSSLLLDERPSVAVWKDRVLIEQYADTDEEEVFGPSFKEDKLVSISVTSKLLPYPILESENILTIIGEYKKVYQVLIPAYVETAVVEVSLTPGQVKEVVGSITFCVIFDATGSMGKYAVPVAATIEEILNILGSQQQNVSVGFIFYRDIYDKEPYLIIEPAPLRYAEDTLNNEAKRMTGGGDTAEPVLDAIVLSTVEFDWRGGTAQQGGKKVAIVVANDDAKKTTIGLSNKVGEGMDIKEVCNLLNSNHITVFSLQAGTVDVGNLKKTLATLAEDTGGEFYPYGADKISKDFAGRIKRLITGTVLTARKKGEEIAKYAIPRDKDYSVLPLKVLDPELLSRLQEAAKEFNIKKGGLIINKGWMFEQPDLYQEKILIEKETLEKLIAFFNFLSDSGVDCKSLVDSVRENLKAILGEEIEEDVEIQELVEKKLGIHFRTNLLAFPLDTLCSLNKKQRLILQNRIQKASGKLGSFLEAATPIFNEQRQAWMKVSFLP